MREYVIEHIREILDIVLIRKSLLRSQILHSTYLTPYSFARFCVNIKTEESLPWKCLKKLMLNSLETGLK